MKLSSITVKNYRSIDDPVVLDFKKTAKPCYFMFGINETGKSNVLRACALLNPDYAEKYKWGKDCYKANRRDEEITEIDYYFDFLPEEKEEIKKQLSSKVPKDILDQVTGYRRWVEGDKDSKITKGNHLIFEDVKKLEGYFQKKKGAVLPSEAPAVVAEGETPPPAKAANPMLFFKKNEIEEADFDQFEPAVPNNFCFKLSALLEADYLDSKLPRVIFWDSGSRYLISGTVDLNAFKEDPKSVSVPLFNMFKFIGFDEDTIKDGITVALTEATDRHQLATDLSQATTKHLNKIWKEHEVEVQITIESNGACDVHFTDKDANTNYFEMQDRSDGFQRFISFILTLSAENLNEELKNTLVLLDEPEVHLHPSGIEYLKDELLNIAENNNYVLAASHSIFLVDKRCLERHITVKKIAGKTSISYITPENPFQEEVIFRALNTSIYELVQPLSIVFEGSIDSDIFLATKHKFRTELTGLQNVGGIGATGASEVKKYEKFFRGNLMVRAVALFDSDGEGRRELASIRTSSLFDDNAFEVRDILDIGKLEFEFEDLLPEEVVLGCAKDLYNHTFVGVDQTKSVLDEIKRIKHEQNILDDKKLEILKERIAAAVIRDTDSHVLSKAAFRTKYDVYYRFLEALQTKLSSIGR